MKLEAMARITVTVNGRAYDLTCDDGDEAHVRELARSVDTQIAQLVATLGQVGENRLLLLAALMVAHELSEARKNAAASSSSESIVGDEMVLGELAVLVDRIEAIAQHLEES